ncbi:hypothetical protein [Breoghania sp. JC706]|uniref:hypothetical protein n=1 Tax=Breoghania sp. JC706 TaxID=3117732 RepID=UPI00300A7BB5
MELPQDSYREFSQEYAKGGIRAVIFVNGGAAVATLSQLTALSNLFPKSAIGIALISFIIGILFGVLTWVAGFISNRHVDRKLRNQEKTYLSADIWMYIGIFLSLLSISAFAFGCLRLAVAFMIDNPAC